VRGGATLKYATLKTIHGKQPRLIWFFRDQVLTIPAMLSPNQTIRQRMIELLTNTRLTTYQLANMLGTPERQVEDHLAHVVKTVARDRARRFVHEPSGCLDCGFLFRDRRRLTRPSRCPHCRSEGISAPRYGIDLLRSGSAQEETHPPHLSDTWKGQL